MEKSHSTRLIAICILLLFYGTTLNAQLVLGPNRDDTAPLLTSSNLTYSPADGYYIADVTGGPGYCRIVPNSFPITIYIIEHPQLIIYEYPDGPILDARAVDPGTPITFIELPVGINTLILEFQTSDARVGVSGNDVLPVEITLFNAECRGLNVGLIWQTATEVNNYGFSVERRVMSEDWKEITFVKGSGNSNSPKNYSFTDNLALTHDLNLDLDRISYRLKQIDFDGKFEYSDVVEVKVETPTQFILAQNYPNPFNPETTINYQLPQSSHVTLKVYNVLGKEVATLVDEQKATGNYDVKFNAGHLERSREISSGLYFYTLRTSSGYTATKKLLLIK